MKVANVSAAQLEYLVAALETTTWKEAADRTSVSASAFSQGIAELERRLGVRLFDRQGRGRVPTTEAESAGAHARRVLSELRELTRWAEEVREGATGQLRIGMIDTAAVHHFGDVLMGYRGENPDISVRLIVRPTRELVELLTAGEVDLIVTVEPDSVPGLQVTPLVVEPLYVYAPPDSVVGAASTWGPWVSFPTDSRTRSHAASRLRRRGVNFDVVAESSQPAVLREMVQLGMGWTVLSAIDGERGPHALDRAHPDPVAERVLAMSLRADRIPTRALRRLIDALLAASASLDESAAS